MISRAEFDAYSSSLERLSRAGGKVFQAQALTWARERPDASVSDIRDFAIEAMNGVGMSSVEAASALSARFYDEVATAAGADLPAADTVSYFDLDKVDRVVRYQATKLSDGESVSQDALLDFCRQCGEFVSDCSKQAANWTIMRNARRDRKRGARFARIPSGSDTCGFCMMLVGRGPVYFSAETAGEQSHYHRGCDCRIVPSFGDSAGNVVGGVEWRRYRDAYADCVSTLGGESALDEEWDGLPDERRKELVGRYGSTSKAKSRYKASRIAAELETRDPQWVKTGNKSESSKERGAKPWKKEIAVGEILRENGFDIVWIKETSKTKVPDAALHGVRYEFKVPEGYNKKTVKNQFKKAVGKGTNHLVISNLENGAHDADMIDDIRAILSSDGFVEIDDVLYVSKSGSVLRLKR